MKRIVIVGSQWGDEGKGKITDYLAQKADVVVRYQGGNNAGHTVIFDGRKHSLHLLPSGILNPNIINVMANGMVIDPKGFVEELSKVTNKYQLFVSNRAHVVLPFHKIIDQINENKKLDQKIGTTHKGIGPAYTDKYARVGLRMSEFVNKELFIAYLKRELAEKNEILKSAGFSTVDVEQLICEFSMYADVLRPLVTDTSVLLNELIENDKKVLFEGAQGVMLCIEHGTYPYVTSSSPTAASVPVNTGIAPWLLEGSIGVTKAYTTRVGEGVFPSEIFDELASEIRERGHEYGTTTKRPRRIGWLDTVVLRHAKRVSGLSYLAITLLDVLSSVKTLKIVTHYELDGEIIDYVPADIETNKRCKPVYIELDGWDEDITNVTSFEELPQNAQIYLNTLSELIGVKIAIFSVGPDRNQTVEILNVF
ncbi:MAG: adenylosuccinate synthase [Acholeplasmataceae bacterium]